MTVTVGRCAKCHGHHNILLCTKNEEESALRVNEMEDPSSDDSEDEEIDNYTCNRDNVNVMKGRTDDKKDKKVSKGKKAEKEEGDECVLTTAEAIHKEEKVSKLR